MKQCLGGLCGVVVSVPNHLLLSQKQQYHTNSLLFLFVSHLCHFLSHTNILILLQHKLPPTTKHKHNLQTSHLHTNNKKTTTISFYPGHHLNLPHLVMQLLLKLLSSHGGRRKGDMGAGGKGQRWGGKETIILLSGRQRNRTCRHVYIHEIRKEEVPVENVKKRRQKDGKINNWKKGKQVGN